MSSEAIKLGSVTVDHNGVGTVALKTLSNVVLLSPRELDDAIEALCAMRQSLDPAGYAAFVDRLIPHSTPVSREIDTAGDFWGRLGQMASNGGIKPGPPIHIKDIESEPHSGTVAADGRTSVVLDDD